MLKLLTILVIVAVFYFFVFNGSNTIEGEVDKEPEVLYQPQDKKAEGIDPSIHKSSDLGRFGL
jgi:hypothetical protein